MSGTYWLTKKMREALNRELVEIKVARPLFGRSIDGLGGGPNSLCWRIQDAHKGLSKRTSTRSLLEQASRLPKSGVPAVLIPSSRFPHVVLLLAERAIKRDDVHHSTKRALRRIVVDILESLGESAVSLLGELS